VAIRNNYCQQQSKSKNAAAKRKKRKRESNQSKEKVAGSIPPDKMFGAPRMAFRAFQAGGRLRGLMS
jgi:hypothetical protein